MKGCLRNAGGSSKLFAGDRWTAIREMLKWLNRERFKPLVNKSTVLGDFLWQHESSVNNLTRDHYRRMYKYLDDEDPWAFNPAVVKEYLKSTRQKGGNDGSK